MAMTPEEQTAFDAATAASAKALADLKVLQDAETARKASEVEAKRVADEVAAKASGDFNKLKAEADAEKAKAAKQIEDSLVDTAILREAIKLKIKKDDYLALIKDRSGIKVENGVAVGADKVVATFHKANLDLFGEVETPSTGSGRKPKPSGEKLTAAEERAEARNTSSQKRFPLGWNKETK